MIKKLLAAAIAFCLCGCSSFGKGVAEAILEKNEKEDTRRCEIRGSTFSGIEEAFNKKNTVKILMIHGVGTHAAGYSTRLRENLADSLGLDTVSKREKNITLVNPNDMKTEIGNLRVMQMSDSNGGKDLIFYELTWSGITSPEKQILHYDTSGKYTHKRAAFNNSMKGFLDDVVPDPMIYLMDKDNLILNGTKQAMCWMLGRRWDELKDGDKDICHISSYQQIKNLSNENIIFITHSLGSRILMDSMVEIVQQVGEIDGKADSKSQRIIDELKNKEITVFMMANQLPLLQIARPQPQVHNKIAAYCSPKGKKYRQRVFKKVNIIAFSDPNDLLSYDIPQSFVDSYIDSRMCPEVTNVSLNVAEIISAFGVGVVNPVTAHTEYDNDARVIEMMTQGTADFKQNKLLSRRCNFTRLRD